MERTVSEILEFSELNIFGEHSGVILSIPGGLFEIFFGIWLIFKGFEDGKVVQS